MIDKVNKYTQMIQETRSIVSFSLQYSMGRLNPSRTTFIKDESFLLAHPLTSVF